LDPALHGSNDAVGVSGPDEGLGIGCAGRPAKSRWCESITMKE
jgi:hypothetical protein